MARKLRVLDLFSGIGGFSLGLERTGGFETVAFCEIEPYPRAVLAKHWPHVPCYEDVRTLTADTLARDGIDVDVICGGFPCQDVSFAGKRAGLEGARSGLWGEYARLIGELRPRFVIVENVPGLLSLGMGTVLGDLASLGYDATWDCIPAAAVGAPHRRDRVWIVAYAANAIRRQVGRGLDCGEAASRRQEEIGAVRQGMRHASNDGFAARGADAPHVSPMHGPSLIGGEQDGDHAGVGNVADASINGRKQRRSRDAAQVARGRDVDRGGEQSDGLAHAELSGCEWRDEKGRRASAALPSSWWLVEPDVGRVAHGVPCGTHGDRK